jgi:lipopolysaccharide export system protein LptA
LLVTIGGLLLIGQVTQAVAEPERASTADDSGLIDREPGSASGKSTTGFSLPGSESDAPVEIEAETLEFDARENVAVFRGDVVTTQGDVVMHSASLRVEFAGSNGKLGRMESPQSVVAVGDVRIVQGARVASGNRAEFDDAKRRLVLSGDAVLQEGSNQVRGERVIVYLDGGRSVVEGTHTRVKAILVPDADPVDGSGKGDSRQGVADSGAPVDAGSRGDGGGE